MIATVRTMRGCRPLSDDEFQRVLGSFSGPWALRDRALFVLGCRAGFRVMELLSLRVDDVLTPAPDATREISPAAIAARITVARRNMKRRRQGRTVPVHGDARQALAAWLEDIRTRWPDRLTPELPVFFSRKRRRRPAYGPLLPFGDGLERDDADDHATFASLTRQAAWVALNRAYSAASVYGSTGTHTMRKTFARRVHIAGGRDLVRTQQALGHANIASTMAYLASSQDDVDRAILDA